MTVRLLIAAFLGLILSVSCIKDDDPVEFELTVGEQIPEFSVVMNDGSTVSSSSLYSGVAVIMFFHTSCPDCCNTLPSLQTVYDQFNSSVKFLLMSRQQSGEEIAQYWNEMGYTMPYSPQEDKVVYNLFATTRVPRVYICKDGIIKSIYTDNPVPTLEQLQRDIQNLLK